eukprot:COSAG02_NODE_67247_length_253_cov_0.779221_1_plen_56_part_01
MAIPSDFSTPLNRSEPILTMSVWTSWLVGIPLVATVAQISKPPPGGRAGGAISFVS